MNKYLVHNEQEYVNLFRDFDLEDAERFLGCMFAYVDGTYPDSYEEDDEDEEVRFLNQEQDVDRSTYRKENGCSFPTEYPCAVLLANEHTFDRTGPIGFEFL